MTQGGDSRTGTPAATPAWLRACAGGVRLTVYVQPGAKRTAVVGTHGNAIKIQIQAPPLEDRANDALIEFVARCCGVPRRLVQLTSGGRSRTKQLFVPGLEVGEALARMGAG
ncbi:MAG TPA: DUF167 domain-containing protein [Burkholderiaceae bacterium]|nr:DUF167 domain-containing protein [Burkholderiaceae bacterium]